VIPNPSTPTPLQPNVTFEDRLGTRFEAVSPEGDPVEVLELKEQFANVPSFEFSLRKRVNTLTAFRDPSCATVRGVRLGGGLAVVSDRVRGTRLSTVLEAYERDLLPIEFNAAVCILRQLVPAVAILHETMPDVCHGTIAPERIVITPEGRVVIVEHVLASALESLRYSDQQYWEELRIAVPKTAGPSCFDQRSDVLQIGLVALALIHGRSLNLEGYPVPTASLSERAWAATASGGLEPLPSALRMWLNRTLQLEPKQAFNTASAVWSELKHALPQSNSAELPALKAALARYGFDSLPALPTPSKGMMASAAAGSAAVAPAQPLTPAPRPAAPAPVTPAPRPMASAPAAEVPEPVARPVITPKPAAARPVDPLPVDPLPAAMPTPVRMPIAAQTPIRTPMPVPVPPPMATPAPAARMQPSPVAAPTPAPAKPAFVPAAVTSATSQSDSGPNTRTVRASVRDVNPSQPAAPKPSEDSTTIRTPRASNPISANTTGTDDRPFEARVAAAAPEPAYKFAVQEEEDQNDMPHNMTYNTPPWWRRRSTAAAVFVVLAAGVGVAGRSLFSPSADAAVPGTLVIETNPPGVAVVLDGKRSGQTPVTLEVAAGSHVLTLLTEPSARTIPITIAAGATVSQYVEVPKVVAETGQLQIRTEPSGARVVVDGTPRGSAPVTVENLMPGSHTVDVSNEHGSVRQEITVAAGTTSSLVVPMRRCSRRRRARSRATSRSPRQWTCRSTRTSGSSAAAAAIA
jgi:serine/threonine protein kinase